MRTDHRFGLFVVVILTGLGVSPGVAVGQVEAVANAMHDLQLGFTVGGAVQTVQVKPGDHVKKGQTLISLKDEEGRILVELYKLRVDSDLEVQSAKAQLALAEVERDAIQQAFDRNAASSIEVERAVARYRVAEIDVFLTERNSKELRHQYDQAKARHDQYTLLAPVDGVVDEIVVETGEIVEDLKPILRMVVIDPLWVDVAVPTGETLGLKLKDPVWVGFDLPGYEKPIQGRVIHIASVADAASATRLVRIEVPNTRQLPAGCHVTVSFEPPETRSTQATLSDPVALETSEDF